MRQGNDLGTQYRSCLYTQSDAHLNQSQQTLTAFQAKLSAANYPAITTELAAGEHFYYAEHYHQQYLAKVPNGYCGIGGTGVCY
jgi:peptide-methionine (S)-S-oxide reductase